jgi:hypothetical protein
MLFPVVLLMMLVVLFLGVKIATTAFGAAGTSTSRIAKA